MKTAQINSERIDDIPLLMRWLLDMHIDQIVDNVLGTPHGNRQGLSYGQLAVVFVAYILSQCNHFLSPVRDWVSKHQHVLTQALGCPIRDTDFTDDRLQDLLDALGDDAVGEQLEEQFGQHLIRPMPYRQIQPVLIPRRYRCIINPTPACSWTMVRAKTIGLTCASSKKCSAHWIR